MEGAAETDNTTKNIVHEIVRECDKEDVEINTSFCIYYVKLITLDPVWKISAEKKINRDNIQNLVSFILEKVKLYDSPSLITLKIQNLYLSNIIGKANMVEKHRREIRNSLEPLLQNILNFDVNDTNKQRLFKRINLYISLMAYLANAKNPQVLKESAFALKSVFDDTELQEFEAMKSESKKIEQLHYLQNLVTGIRLFNRDCGRQCVDFYDLPKILMQNIVTYKNQLKEVVNSTSKLVNILTTTIEVIFFEEGSISRSGQNPQKDFTLEDIENTIDSLILIRQYENYLLNMQTDIEKLDERSRDIIKNNLQYVMQLLHNTIKYRMAISTQIVFPLFLELANAWKRIQDEVIVFTYYCTTFEKMQELLSNYNLNLEKAFLLIGDRKILSDRDRILNGVFKHINKNEIICDILYLRDIENFYETPLHFSGYCVWSFVETHGGLLKGNRDLGIMRWKNNFYAFINVAAAVAFGKDPDRYLQQAFTIIRKKPELINFLNVYNEIYEVRNVDVLYEEPPDIIEKVDEFIQTELHPIPENIDPKYIWNIWDYYRLGLHLASIANCRTKAVNTRKTFFRCGVAVQTTELRNKEIQTKKDNYVNHATPLNYIFNLRGSRDDNQFIVNLTRPIDEDLIYKNAAAANRFPPPKMKSEDVKCPKFKKIKKPFKTDSLRSSSTNIPPTNYSELLKFDMRDDNFEDCICVKSLQAEFYKNNI